MKNIKSLLNKFTNTKQKKIIFSLVSICLVFLICFGLSKTNFVRNLLKMAGIYTQEEKVIDFYSDGWDSNEPGSIKVTKSAEWVGEDTAEITFDIESKVKSDVENVDVILAVNTTNRNLDTLTSYKNKLQEFTDDLLKNNSNMISLISYNSSSGGILAEFSNDANLIKDKIDSLGYSVNADYFTGLNYVEQILSTYTKQNDRDVIVLFIVPSFNQNYKAYAKYDVIKEKYSYVTINGIQLDMGNYIEQSLSGISDKQYIAQTDNLNEILLRATYNQNYYESFTFSEYINKDFYIENESDIEVPFGDIKLSEDDGTQKVTWSIGADELLSGSNTTLSLKLHLDSKYHEVEDYYAVGNKTSIVYNFTNEESITTTSSNTPVLKNGYKVVYDANPPTGCNITSLSEETHFAFNNVIISNEKPVCDGYVFGGWNIVTENVEQVNETEFIMSSSNVDIKGTWKKLSISKSMQGTIYEKPTLYETIMYQSRGTDLENNINFSNASSNTNGKGVYTFSGTENDEYPVYYYRGAVTNNNVLFANFCWKIVRTTETGGVKLIYNGVPTNGTCNNTGTASQLESTSAFNTISSSPSHLGYMYGESFNMYRKGVTWYQEYYNTSPLTDSYVSGTNYIYGKEIEYSSSNGYTILDGDYHSWDSEYQNLKGYYTCANEYGFCSRIYYIVDASSTTMTYINMGYGNTYEKAEQYLKSSPYIIGKSVDYSNGTYTIKNTKTISVLDWENNYNLGEYRYFCSDNTTSCSTAMYIHNATSTEMSYIEVKNGYNFDDVVKAMTSESTNINSSTIKTIIDEWYKTNMNNYTSYLEDTTWCNDRSIYSYGGWSVTGKINSGLMYGSRGRVSQKFVPSLICENEVDQFRVGNPKAKLTYPVGLITGDEANLAGGNFLINNSNYYLYTANDFWLMSPSVVHRNYPGTIAIMNLGNLDNPVVNNTAVGVRPSISLVKDTNYTDGDGSINSPYVIEVD